MHARKQEGYFLQPVGSSEGAVTLAAFTGGDEAGGTELTALIVDVLAVSDDSVLSGTGDAWKVFDADTARGSNLLIAKKADYSVCKISERVPSNSGALLGNGEYLSAYIGANAAVATAATNILGLSPHSYVRLRLTSNPTDAVILLDGIRQPTRTNTIMDVLASVIPLLRIEKAGYEPCSLDRGSLVLRQASRRLINANCDLRSTARKKKRR